MIDLNDFLKLIELLETKEIDYALVGGVAMMAIAQNPIRNHKYLSSINYKAESLIAGDSA